MELKTCSRCKVPKTLDQFYESKKNPGHYGSHCKECSKTAALNWWKTHREQAAETIRKRLPRLRKQKLKYQRRRNREIKALVMTHYAVGTPKCACCLETHIEFLTIDHIEGGGTKHRKMLGPNGCGSNIYWWLIKNSYPESYRVLCYNCNCSIGYYGYCPHQSRGA